jgi:hypothetical protein
MSTLKLENRQQLFDSVVGIVFEKQYAFVDTVPDHCWNWKWESSGDSLLVNFPHLGTYEYQQIGTEHYESNTWTFSWSDDKIPASQSRASAAFRDHFKDHHDPLLCLPSTKLSKVNGDYISIIATQLAGASTYFTWPDEERDSTSFFLLFNVPLLEFNPPRLMRIVEVLGMMENSTQIKDKPLAIREYLQAKGFKSKMTKTTAGQREEFKDQTGRLIAYEYEHSRSKTGNDIFSISKDYLADLDYVTPQAILATASPADFQAHLDYFVRTPLNRIADFS